MLKVNHIKILKINYLFIAYKIETCNAMLENNRLKLCSYNNEYEIELKEI